MKPDVVYTLKPNPLNDEFRYSLRSLVNLPHKDVWVIGYKPIWAKVKFIPSRAVSRRKISNTNHNWLKVALNSSVSDPFILMNDDFFINKPMENIPTEHMGTNQAFQDFYDSAYPASHYTWVIKNTTELLKKFGITNGKSYELHTPMLVYKKDIIKALRNHDYLASPVNIRTVIGNIGNYGGRKAEDVKVYGTEKEKHRSLINYKDSKFISTDDIAFTQEVGHYIKETFKEVSEYEISSRY